MKKLPPLPKSELEIARLVWGLGDATVRQVVEALPAERELDFWTVQTYLRRLKDKEYLEVRKDRRNNVYSTAVDPDRVIGADRRHDRTAVRRSNVSRVSTSD